MTHFLFWSILDLYWVVWIRIMHLEDYCSHKNILRMWLGLLGFILTVILKVCIMIMPIQSDFRFFDLWYVSWFCVESYRCCWMLENWQADHSPGPPAPSAVGLPPETVELHAYLKGRKEGERGIESVVYTNLSSFTHFKYFQTHTASNLIHTSAHLNVRIEQR